MKTDSDTRFNFAPQWREKKRKETVTEWAEQKERICKDAEPRGARRWGRRARGRICSVLYNGSA